MAFIFPAQTQDPSSQANFDELRKYLPGPIDGGIGVLVFIAAALAVVTVPHSLNRVPRVVLLSIFNQATLINIQYDNLTSVSFRAVGYLPAAATYNQLFSWATIG